MHIFIDHATFMLQFPKINKLFKICHFKICKIYSVNNFTGTCSLVVTGNKNKKTKEKIKKKKPTHNQS